MKYTSEIDCATNICTVRITGKYFRPKDSEELKHLAVNTYTEHGCNLFLFDMTQAEIIMGGTTPTFYAANPQGELGEVLRKLKVAFVCREISEEDRFFETVAVNRGFWMHAFDDLDKANEWLKKKGVGDN